MLVVRRTSGAHCLHYARGIVFTRNFTTCVLNRRCAGFPSLNAPFLIVRQCVNMEYKLLETITVIITAVQLASSSSNCSNYLQCEFLQPIPCCVCTECTCAAVTVSCENDSIIEVKIMFHNQETKCEFWWSNDNNAVIRGTKTHMSVFVNSTVISMNEIGVQLWCYRHLLNDSMPVGVLFRGSSTDTNTTATIFNMILERIFVKSKIGEFCYCYT